VPPKHHHSSSAKIKNPSLCCFFFVSFFCKNPNHPNHHSLPKMSKKLDMSLDDVIRDSRRSGGHNDSSRGRGRASSGPGPDRRFASRNAVRTVPYYVPQVTWVVRSLSLYSLYVWYPRKRWKRKKKCSYNLEPHFHLLKEKEEVLTEKVARVFLINLIVIIIIFWV
jgi:hypothetical protein